MRRAVAGSFRAHVAATVAVRALTATAPAGARAETVTIAGTDSRAVVDCSNVTDGDARRRNRCQAQAEGGGVVLEDVDIHFRGRDGLEVNGGEVDAISVAGGDGEAGAICVDEAGDVVDARQISVCRARARGGRVAFRKVEVLIHHANGKVTRKRRTLVAIAVRPARRRVVCVARGNATADCEAMAGGASVQMRGVDLVDRASGTTRADVNLSVTGGDASARVTCGNAATGGAAQVNRCSSRALGGDVRVSDVRLHFYRPRSALAGRPRGQRAVNLTMSCAVSSGRSSWGQWPMPASSTQSAWGSQSSRKRAAADGHGRSRSSVPHTTRTGQVILSASRP